MAGRRRFSREQIEALEDLLLLSKDLGSFGKQFATWLLAQSKGLTHNICVAVPSDLPKEEKDQIGYGLHDIASSGCATHIDDVMRAMGTKKRFHVAGYRQSYKAWLSAKMFDPEATPITFDLEAIKRQPLLTNFDRRHGHG
ncbi:MAG: hypothetical protein WC528_01570 [Patescibacteria group bacterium]